MTCSLVEMLSVESKGMKTKCLFFFFFNFFPVIKWAFSELKTSLPLSVIDCARPGKLGNISQIRCGDSAKIRKNNLHFLLSLTE